MAAAPPARTIQSKLVLLGHSAVGKSSIVLQFVKQQFSGSLESTIGAAFWTKKIELPDLCATVKLEIWDTAGQENNLAPMYYRRAQAALVVYDIAVNATFESAQRWVEELRTMAENAENMVVALVGNKLDLAESRQVERAVAEAYAKENDLLYFETSAKTGEHVHALFDEIARHIARQQPEEAPSTASGGGVNLQLAQPSSERVNCC